MDGTVAVLGLGLMGGSLALALRRREPGVTIRACARRAATRAEAERRGLADAVFADPAEAVRGAGLTVICVPVERIPEVALEARAGFADGAVVTDVGSTKAWVEAETLRALAGTPAAFVGSHPVAGSERQGLEAARADLYEGAVAVVTGVNAAPSAEARVADLWRAVGCRVLRMPADRHDRILARTSHLPHLAAAALALASARGDGDARGLLCGPGFRDATRIADGGPELWREIVATNRDAILDALDDLGGALKALTAAVRDGRDDRLERLLGEARDARRRLLAEGTEDAAAGGEEGGA